MARCCLKRSNWKTFVLLSDPAMSSAVVLSAAPGLSIADSAAGAAIANPLEALSANGGLPALAIDLFSGLAVATSAIGFIEGLNQLWNDSRISVLKENPGSVAANPEPSYALSVIPPIVLSALLPGSFLSALDIGGLYGVATLFGVLPATMAWRQRYSLDASLATATKPALPGGRLSLAAMIGLPSLLITYNTLVMFHVIR